jgi:hypothetical protein
LRVKRFIGGDVVPNQKTMMGGSWVITRGTGRFTQLRGNGTMFELWDHSRLPATLGGRLTGVVRHA